MDDLLARGSEKWTKYPPDVLPAWVAEMDFALAPPVRDALRGAVELGDLGYIGNVDGLIEAMYYFYDRRLGWDLEGQYIALVADVMVGFKELLLVHTQPGDGVIINPPAYPPYFKDIAHVGRRVVEVPLLDDFGVDVDGLDRAFGAGAKALLLCSPHNPSGRVYTRDELAAVAAVAEAHGALVVVDEIHAPLTFGATFTPWQHVLRRRHGAHLGLEGVQPAGAQARVRGRRGGVRAATRTCATTRATRAWSRREAAFTDGDEWLDETIATIAANQRRCRRCCRRACGSRTCREASYLAWLECDFDDPAARFLERGRVALNHGPSSAPRTAATRGSTSGRGPSSCARRQPDGVGAGLSSTTSTTWRRREREVRVALGLARAVEPRHLGVGERAGSRRPGR